MANKTYLFFVKRLLLFLLPFFALFAYLEINLRHVPTSYYLKRDLLEKNASQIEVLNVGSSQSLYSFAPRFIHPHYFNLADISQTIYYDRRITEKYLPQMPNLKLVIIPVSYFVLWSQLHDGVEQWREYYYLQYWGIDFPETNWYDIKKYSAVFLYEPKHALGFIRTNFERGHVLNMDYEGWIPRSEIGDDTTMGIASARKRVELHNSAISALRMPQVVSDLRSFIEDLQEKKIKVVLVSTPLYKTYTSFTNPSIVSQNDSIIKALCNDYKIQYFNYTRDSNFLMTDFFDTDHLNEFGAEKFSQKVKKDIVDVYLKQ